MEQTIDVWHTGPGTLAGRYLRRFWQPVYCAKDLAQGQLVPLRIMNEELTLFRGDGGAPHLVGGRCAHRGTLLSTGWVEGESVRCVYHGWRYDEAGQCLEQPAENDSFAARVRIAGYPAREYAGFVWAWMGEGAPPEMPRFPWLDSPGVNLVGYHDRPCNFIQHLENTGDEVHVAFLHRRTLPYWNQGLKRGAKFDVPVVTSEETDYGIQHDTLRASGQGRRVYFLAPNTGLVCIPAPGETPPWRPFIAIRVPIDDFSHRTFTSIFASVTGEKAGRVIERHENEEHELARMMPREEVVRQILAAKLTLRDVEDRPDRQVIEDDVTQVGQGALYLRENEHLGKSDHHTVVFRRIWERELEALAAGRPLKRWKVPEGWQPALEHPGIFIEA